MFKSGDIVQHRLMPGAFVVLGAFVRSQAQMWQVRDKAGKVWEFYEFELYLPPKSKAVAIPARSNFSRRDA